MQASYFFGTSFAGTAEIPGEPDSIAYFCSTCGDCWARVIVQESVFQIRNVPCERHERSGVFDWSSTPGSILVTPGVTSNMLGQMFWAAALDYLPEPVLRREFNLAMKNHDNS
jgi:hypothetical protein